MALLDFAEDIPGKAVSCLWSKRSCDWVCIVCENEEEDQDGQGDSDGSDEAILLSSQYTFYIMFVTRRDYTFFIGNPK